MSGTRLGPYEILSAIGAGGMGEVYRARDSKLDRDVAIKVLPAPLAGDSAALARFEREAKAVAALSHPNILSIFDFGSYDGVVYVAMELLEGQTLRELIAATGALPTRKVIDYCVQAARALAAAHGRGIYHRDLKPENIFVTVDGRVKILDFGLALRASAFTGADVTLSPTVGRLTDPGTVVGTVGYMSPEQVRGEAGDHRSDIFAFGCVLYELVAGRRAFQSATAAETMTAILREEPHDLAAARSGTSQSVARIVQHCLEKNPAERFQSMSDVAFALEALSGSTSTHATASATAPADRPARRPGTAAVVAAAIVAAGVAGFAVRALTMKAPALPQFLKLTFQRGAIDSARFAPDGQSVVYGASWNGGPLSLYSARFDARESRAFGMTADILAISSAGEMALSLDRHAVLGLLSAGRLARAPLAGGTAPRELTDGVIDADWSPDGQTLAVSHAVGEEVRIEFPIGRALFKSGGYLSSPRISPGGDAVAFINHPVKGDDHGTVMVVDRSGTARTLTPDLPSVTGMAWPTSREIWFSAWLPDDGGYGIDGVTLDGRRRAILRNGSRLRLLDVRGDRSLVGVENWRGESTGLLAGDTRERDLSWLDGTVITAISSSGDRALFIEGSEGGGSGASFFLRRSDNSVPVRLGKGLATDLSADGRWALSLTFDQPPHVVVVPTGTGEAKSVTVPSLEAIASASWFPDGKRALLLANEAQQAPRAWILELDSARLKPITPPGLSVGIVGSGYKLLSPDGRTLAAKGADGRTLLYPVDGGTPRPVTGLDAAEEPAAWTGDGRALFVRGRGLPSRVFRVDVATGARSLWKELMPGDPAGVSDSFALAVTPDGRFYAYAYLRTLTELHVVEGLR